MDEQFEWCKLTWEHYKFRHELFWSSLYRWGAATITVTIIPYVKPEIFSWIGRAVIAFPVLAWLMALVAGWHLGAEYFRLKLVDSRFRDLLGAYSPPRVQPTTRWERLFSKSIGDGFVAVFLLGFTVLEAANVAVLWFIVTRHRIS